MKLLVVTNMYPSDKDPVKGIFVKEQVDLIRGSDIVDDVDVVNLGSGGAIAKYFLSSFRVLYKILQYRPDVLHVHYGLTFLPLLFIYPFLRFFRVVVTFHGSDLMGSNRYVLFISKLASWLADVSIVVNGDMREKLYKPKEVQVIPCSINESFFQIERRMQAIEPIVVFPSDPSRPEKNYSYYKRVVNIVEKQIPQIKPWAMVGMTREEVVSLFKIASVLLLTSDREGSPQVVKEALAAGLPVVSRKVGDLTELQGKVNGLYLIDNENEMAAVVQGILVNKKLVEPNLEAKLLFGGRSVIDRLAEAYR